MSTETNGSSGALVPIAPSAVCLDAWVIPPDTAARRKRGRGSGHHDLEQVRALLGHARIDTTQIYASIRPPQATRCSSTATKPPFPSRTGGRQAADGNPMFEEHSEVPQTRSEIDQRNRNGGPNGIRTRVLVAVMLSLRIVAHYELFSSEICGVTRTRSTKMSDGRLITSR